MDAFVEIAGEFKEIAKRHEDNEPK